VALAPVPWQLPTRQSSSSQHGWPRPPHSTQRRFVTSSAGLQVVPGLAQKTPMGATPMPQQGWSSPPQAAAPLLHEPPMVHVPLSWPQAVSGEMQVPVLLTQAPALHRLPWQAG
jgi:hypothetical protein